MMIMYLISVSITCVISNFKVNRLIDYLNNLLIFFLKTFHIIINIKNTFKVNNKAVFLLLIPFAVFTVTFNILIQYTNILNNLESINKLIILIVVNLYLLYLSFIVFLRVYYLIKNQIYFFKPLNIRSRRKIFKYKYNFKYIIIFNYFFNLLLIVIGIIFIYNTQSNLNMIDNSLLNDFRLFSNFLLFLIIILYIESDINQIDKFNSKVKFNRNISLIYFLLLLSPIWFNFILSLFSNLNIFGKGVSCQPIDENNQIPLDKGKGRVIINDLNQNLSNNLNIFNRSNQAQLLSNTNLNLKVMFSPTITGGYNKYFNNINYNLINYDPDNNHLYNIIENNQNITIDSIFKSVIISEHLISSNNYDFEYQNYKKLNYSSFKENYINSENFLLFNDLKFKNYVLLLEPNDSVHNLISQNFHRKCFWSNYYELTELLKKNSISSDKFNEFISALLDHSESQKEDFGNDIIKSFEGKKKLNFKSNLIEMGNNYKKVKGNVSFQGFPDYLNKVYSSIYSNDINDKNILNTLMFLNGHCTYINEKSQIQGIVTYSEDTLNNSILNAIINRDWKLWNYKFVVKFNLSSLFFNKQLLENNFPALTGNLNKDNNNYINYWNNNNLKETGLQITIFKNNSDKFLNDFNSSDSNIKMFLKNVPKEKFIFISEHKIFIYKESDNHFIVFDCKNFNQLRQMISKEQTNIYEQWKEIKSEVSPMYPIKDFSYSFIKKNLIFIKKLDPNLYQELLSLNDKYIYVCKLQKAILGDIYTNNDNLLDYFNQDRRRFYFNFNNNNR